MEQTQQQEDSSFFKNLQQGFTNATNAFKAANTDTVVGKLASTISKSVTGFVKLLDLYLKSKGFDVEEQVNKLKEKSKPTLQKIVDLKNEAKDKGLLQTGKSFILDAGSKLKEKYEAYKETSNGPPESPELVGPPKPLSLFQKTKNMGKNLVNLAADKMSGVVKIPGVNVKEEPTVSKNEGGTLQELIDLAKQNNETLYGSDLPKEAKLELAKRIQKFLKKPNSPIEDIIARIENASPMVESGTVHYGIINLLKDEFAPVNTEQPTEEPKNLIEATQDKLKSSSNEIKPVKEVIQNKIVPNVVNTVETSNNSVIENIETGISKTTAKTKDLTQKVIDKLTSVSKNLISAKNEPTISEPPQPTEPIHSLLTDPNLEPKSVFTKIKDTGSALIQSVTEKLTPKQEENLKNIDNAAKSNTASPENKEAAVQTVAKDTIFSLLMSKLSDIKDGVKSLSNNDETTSNDSKESETKSEITEEKKTAKGEDTSPSTTEAKEKKPSLFQKLKDKFTNKTTSAVDDASEWLKKRQDKQDQRKQEIEEEKKNAKGEKKGKSSNSWIGKIVSAIATAAGFIGGKLFSMAGWLGTKLLSGFGGIFSKLIPALSSSIAGSLGNVVSKIVTWKNAKEGVKLAAKGAWEVGKRVGMPIIGALGKGALSIVTGVGLPVLATVAAAAAVGYAGYKAFQAYDRYKHGKHEVNKLRYLMYGFNDDNQSHFSKLYNLEMILKPFVKYNNRQVVVEKIPEDARNEILNLFDVKREDKEKYDILNTWLTRRFFPSFKAFVSALFSHNDKIYLDDIHNKLGPGDLQIILERLVIPTTIYDIKQIPVFEQPVTYVTQEEIVALREKLLKEYGSKNKDDKTINGKPKEPVKPVDQQQKPPVKPNESETTKPPVVIDPSTGKPTEASKLNTDTAKKEPPPDPAAEGESKPNTNGTTGSVKPDSKETLSSKVSGKLNTATGNLLPGSKSLEGITTKIPKEKIYNLDPNMFELFTGMAKEYNAITGKSLQVNEAFRSYEDQAALYKKMPGKAAKPGNSVHEFGMGIDVDSPDVKALEDLGLLRKYGFTVPIGKETWHMEPIGVSINPGLVKNDLTKRANAILSSPGRGGGGYGLDPNSVNKKRNTELQASIYNSAGGNPIDIEKAKANSKPNENSPATAPIAVADKTGTLPTDKKVATTASSSIQQPISSGTTKEPTASPLLVKTDSKKTETANVALEEGEKPSGTSASPSLPSAKDKASVVSLDKPNNIPMNNANTDPGRTLENADPVSAIKQAAKVTNNDPSTMITFAKLESSLRPDAKAPTSSASGLFQITKPTWDDLLKKNATKHNIPETASPFNPYYNSVLAGELIKSNLKKVDGYQDLNIDEVTALYLTHHFGPAGGAKIIREGKNNPDQPMQQVVGEKAYNANLAALGGKTIRTYIESLQTKIGKVNTTKFAAEKKHEASTGETSPVTSPSSSVGASSNSNITNMTSTANTNISNNTTKTTNATSSVTPVSNSATTSVANTTINPTTNKSSITNLTEINKPKENIQPPPKPTVITTPTSISGTAPTLQPTTITRKDNPVTPPIDARKDTLSMTKVETLLSDQLSALSQMVNILTSIDGKFDVSKLKENIEQPKQTLPKTDRTPSRDGIDLSRKRIEA